MSPGHRAFYCSAEVTSIGVVVNGVARLRWDRITVGWVRITVKWVRITVRWDRITIRWVVRRELGGS